MADPRPADSQAPPKVPAGSGAWSASSGASASNPQAAQAFATRWLGTVGRERWTLLAVGAACLVLGVVAVTLPARLLGSVVKVVGLLLIGSGAIKALQLVPGLGRHRDGARRRSAAMILMQVALDVGAGSLLLSHRGLSVHLLALALGLLFLAEGGILAMVALKAPTWRAQLVIAACALGTGGLGIAALLQWGHDPITWVGVLVGLKLLLFGLALVTIAWTVPPACPEALYQTCTLVPVVAEAYAVYFGTAFHLGVCIGDGEVVHYLNDNFVYRVTWDEFLAGRVPQHWTYPDLPPVPTEVVVQTALSEVGKTYPYSLLKFNCENFAIFCKSGGATKSSKFAQIGSGFESVEFHPLLGMVAELNTRACEWLAFQFGGPAGRRLSLAIRQLGATVNVWLLTRAARSGRAPAAAAARQEGDRAGGPG